MSIIKTNSGDSNNSTRQRFSVLANKTHCPYASRAKAWFAPEWDATLSVRDNTLRIVPDFDRFIDFGEEQELDIFVIEVRGSESIKDINSFADLLYCVLHTMNVSDPISTSYLTDNIESMEWDFTYRGVEFFIPTFTPFYKASHVRYSYQNDSAFIMFQPDYSFDKYGINRKNPKRFDITNGIREMFERNGFTYDIELISRSIKAVRYIKPHQIGYPPIRWWDRGVTIEKLTEIY
jgi:hypothetical protein